MAPSPLVLLHIFPKPRKMGFSKRQDNVLKVVHPGRHVEVFREPITAGELMKKYPRHCIARPDVFKYPWIVVHPESVLVPGSVFYLVPYHTLDNLLKKTRQQQKSLVPSKHRQSSQKSLVPSKHKQSSEVYPMKSYHRHVNDQESCDPDTRSLYKREFYKFWNKISKNLDQLENQLDLSPENSELQRLKPCLRKPDSARKKLKLKVTFTSPAVTLIN
ncbi:hypothetical protein CDL12_16443 [Handroanthus impetiginosus]|uniref:Uncharacterized protein n=1 Tax=Handroanthus impetiginosus TaxID=429701 RepID=A0A2G9H0B7_9LAMI|nr:hypothetical protein CDL12_16443 [Handroanthus impetiginosus]